MTAQPTEDVHVRAHRPDLAQEHGNEAENGRKSARGTAPAGARIPHLRLVDQEKAPVPDDPEPEQPSRAGLGAALLQEMEAGKAALAAAAEDSDWACEPMTPVAAWKQVAPVRGEAGNWIIWVGMTAAGVARGLMVSIGYLIARGGETRIRASVAAGVFLLALALAYLAGHAS